VPYRWERIEVWLDPWRYFNGKGWHICQSLMGIGSGGPTGVGLGGGIQKLYIPEVTTDFIFAAICEEMGLLGGVLVLGLFGALIWRAGRVVRRAPDRFSFLLAVGIVLVIGLQAAMNVGVATGALPAKGISLPFISYGGSGLVLMSFAAGLLMAVARAAAAGPVPASAEGCHAFACEGVECAPAAGGPATPHPLVYMPAGIEVRAAGTGPRARPPGANDSAPGTDGSEIAASGGAAKEPSDAS